CVVDSRCGAGSRSASHRGGQADLDCELKPFMASFWQDSFERRRRETPAGICLSVRPSHSRFCLATAWREWLSAARARILLLRGKELLRGQTLPPSFWRAPRRIAQ